MHRIATSSINYHPNYNVNCRLENEAMVKVHFNYCSFLLFPFIFSQYCVCNRELFCYQILNDKNLDSVISLSKDQFAIAKYLKDMYCMGSTPTRIYSQVVVFLTEHHVSKRYECILVSVNRSPENKVSVDKCARRRSLHFNRNLLCINYAFWRWAAALSLNLYHNYLARK